MDMDVHVSRLKKSLSEAEKCQKIEFFGVGVVIFDQNNRFISAGYTNEVPNCHAEEVAINKAVNSKVTLLNAILYSTLEPCSKRLSGKMACCFRIIEAGIKRVYFGCKEPPEFVQCNGSELLISHGIEVIQIKSLEQECLRSIVSKRM